MTKWPPPSKPKVWQDPPDEKPEPMPEAKPQELWQLPKQLPDYWYQTPGNVWWVKNKQGVYTPYQTSHVRDTLLNAGVRGSTIPGEHLSPVSRLLLAMREDHAISWAGQLAGFNQGIVELSGKRILVTKSPERIKAKKGSWPKLEKFFTELLDKDVKWLYGWLKSSLRSMHSGHPFRPGQCLIVAGKTGCGKSLLQSIITEMLGGRMAKPFDWLMGETGFNSEIFMSEHLMLEDEACSLDPRKRSQFGQKLKNVVANDLKKCRAMHTEGINLPAFWRITMSLNDQPEALLVMPHITEDVADKIILLRAQRAKFPYGVDDLAGRKEYREQLTSELPALMDWLFHWKIPSAMADQRYGIRGYQDESLLSLLHEMQPEFRLLDLIDHLKPWDVKKNLFHGSASQLQDLLEEKDTRGRVAKLLPHSSSCGQFLGRLARDCPERVRLVKRVHNQGIWEIKPR